MIVANCTALIFLSQLNLLKNWEFQFKVIESYKPQQLTGEDGCHSPVLEQVTDLLVSTSVPLTTNPESHSNSTVEPVRKERPLSHTGTM